MRALVELEHIKHVTPWIILALIVIAILQPFVAIPLIIIIILYHFLKKTKLWRTWEKYEEGPIGTFVYILLGFFIAFTANIVLGYALKTDTPVVAVFSESMVPTYLKGDMIVIQGTQDVKVGDIVVYDSPLYKYPIIHRIVEVSDAGVKTKGDNNRIADPWTTPLSKVRGKAVFRIPFLGWVKVGAYELLGAV